MSESKGVVYMLTGTSCAERLAVSLFTLRKHWDGPVTVMVDSDEDAKVAALIAADDRAGIDVQPFVRKDVQWRHQAYVQKTLVPALTPYDRTAFFDADTAIVGDFSKLFNYDWVITSYSDWQSKGRRIANRCGWWYGRGDSRLQIDEMVDRVLADEVVVAEDGTGKVAWRLAAAGEVVRTTGYPAVNTGVVGFVKGCPLGDRWHKMTCAGEGTHMTDEIAMQLLYPFATECEVAMLDDRFNHSPTYGKHPDDIRIIHFHGQKHLKKQPGRSVWEPLLREAMAANFGGLRDWAGTWDKWVRALLDGKDPATVR